MTQLTALRRVARPSTLRDILTVARAFWAGIETVRREPPTSLNGQVGPRRRLVSMSIDAAAAKEIARTARVGVNDLALDLVAGGLRALLAARGEPVARLAPRVGIAIALPSAARTDDAGNHFGSQAVSLALREPDPITRLRPIAITRERAKRTQAATGITAVRVWTARFAPTRALIRRQRFINVIETYLPGPPFALEILGAPVRDLIAIQPLGADVGLTFLASSYAGRITISVRADPDQFPDLDVLMAAMDRDWRRLASVRSRSP
jgi:hypothetical protein